MLFGSEKTYLNPTNRSELEQNEKVYAEVSSKFKSPLYKPWWESKLSEDAKTLFTHRSPSSVVAVIEVLSIIVWTIIVIHLYRTLMTSQTPKFYTFFVAFASFPFISILVDTYTLATQTRFDPSLPPEYPACLTPTENLSPELQASGVVATIKGKCFLTQFDFLRNLTEVIRVKAYNSMYALFSLILVFFTLSNYTKFFKADNPFVRESIRVASLLSLSLFTVSVLGTYYWYSLYILRFYGNLVQMNVSVILMLVGYLLYLLVNRVLVAKK
jgi:hypothetical protein